MTRWLECPICHGVFAFIRDGVDLKPFMAVQSDDYEGWDGEFFERHSDLRCIDCGRLASEMPTSPFKSANVRAGSAPLPRAMITAIGKYAERDAMSLIHEAISIDSYCTLDEKRKLIVPRLRGMSDD